MMLNRILCLCILLCILVFSGLAECNSEIVLYDNLTLDNITCTYKEGESDSTGKLEISCKVKGPAGLAGVRIGSWQDSLPSQEEALESAEMMVSVWQRSEDWLRTLKLPYSTKLSMPVRPDVLNTTQYVIMVGLDTNVNLLGYSVIKVDITDDAGNNGISGITINNSENNDTTDATTEDLEFIAETLGILQADHQFPTSVDDEKLAMYPGHYYQKGDIEIYVLDEAVEKSSDDFQTTFFASGIMELNIMTIGKETFSGYSVIDVGNIIVDQAINTVINSGMTNTTKPGSHVWNNWEANGLKGQWCFLNSMPTWLLVSFEYNGNYYFIGYTAAEETSKTKGLMDAVISSIRPAGGVTISNSTSSISPFTEPTSNQEITATCNTNKVNVRTEPDGSRSIGQINKGDKVTVLETQGEWSRISCKHGEGWVKTKFLQ